MLNLIDPWYALALAGAFSVVAALLVRMYSLRLRTLRAEGSTLMYQAALDTASDHVLVIDAEGTIIAANRAWREYAQAAGTAHAVGNNYRATCLEKIGKTDTERAELWSGIAAVIAGEGTAFIRDHFCEEAEALRCFRISAHLIQTPFRGAVIRHRDIMEEYNAERKLLTKVIAAMPDPAFLVNEQGLFEYTNTAATDVFGYTQEEFQGMAIEALVPHQTRPHHQALRATYHREPRARAMAANKHLHACNKFGIEFPVEVSLSPLMINQAPMVIASVTDLTWQRAAEQSLRESEARFRAVVELSVSPLMLRDDQDRIFYLNSAFIKTFGYTLEDIHTIHDWRFQAYPDPEYRNWAIEVWENRYQAGQESLALPLEMHLRDKSGVDHICLISGALLEGHREGIVALSFFDITPLKSMETTLIDLNNSLESRVEERTRELEAARQQAEESSRAKSQFLANMSHEIRTPMNAVLGLTHLALTEPLTPRLQEHLKKIQGAGELLLGIINDVLDFSKIEAGKFSLEIAPFEMLAALDRVRSLCVQRIREKGLLFKLSVDDNVPLHLQGDRLRLEQVLLNFLSNAVKFTTQGEITLNVSCLKRSATDCMLRFVVRDTGIGIDPTARERIFRAFEQADGSITRRFGGTGLGLAINKAFLHSMGATLGVESTLGEGTTFWFEIKFALASAIHPAALSIVQEQPLKGMRILIVDDSEINREIARETLEQAGATVVTASDGIRALDILDQMPVDRVLMDMQMPIMDGLETTRQIRVRPALRTLPVIAMTANASPEDRAACLASGMNDFLTKPFVFNTLLSKLLATSPQEAPALAATTELASLPVDFAILETAVNGDEARMKKFATLFLRNGRSEIQALERAAENGDHQTLGQIGHKLKSSAKWVGAMQFAEVCQRLEKQRNAPDPALARADIDLLKQLFAQTEQAFAARLGDLTERPSS